MLLQHTLLFCAKEFLFVFRSWIDVWDLLSQECRDEVWLAPLAGKMNQILHCDWLPKWAMVLSCLLGITCCVPQENSVLFPCNKICGGAVASWLVRSTPERAFQVRALAGDIDSVVFLGKTLYSHSASLHPGV